MTDNIGNVNNIINVEEPAGAQVNGEDQTPYPVVKEEQKQQPSTRVKDSTSSSPPLPPTSSAHSTTVETQSNASTNPILEDSQADTGETTPLQDDLTNGDSLQHAVTHAPSFPPLVGGSSASYTVKDDSPADRPRGVMARLLSCCSRQ